MGKRLPLLILLVSFAPVVGGYSYVQGKTFAEGNTTLCAQQSGRAAFVDTYCAATSATTSIRACCKGTEAVLLYYGSSQSCIGPRSNTPNYGLGQLKPAVCNVMAAAQTLIPEATCMTANEPFVVTATNAGQGSAHQVPSGHCSYTSNASSTQRTCTGMTSLRIETFSASNTCAGAAASLSIVIAPYTDGATVYSCAAYTHTDLPECVDGDAIGITPQGWTNVLAAPQKGWSVYDSSPRQAKPGVRQVPLYNDFPHRMVGSQAKPIPTMQTNLHLRKFGTINAKETKPSYLTSPDAGGVYVRGECEDKAPPSLCHDWARIYKCESGFVGGKGDREAEKQTLGQLCPSACKSSCMGVPYRDLDHSTLKKLGFDFWWDEEHFTGRYGGQTP